MVVITGLTPTKRTMRAVDEADDQRRRRGRATTPSRISAGAHLGGDDEGGEHDRQAHQRADRDVEAAHHQHVELRHGDQRQRRGREQDVADVERRQEDVGLRTRRSRRRRASAATQEGQRHPPLVAAAGDDLAERCRARASRRRSSAPSLRAARATSLRGEERGDDALLADLAAASASRMMRPREKTSTRSQMPASSSASDELTMQATPCVGLGADGAVDVEARLGVDALGRLVDEHDLGAVQEAPRQHRLLLVAAGEAADRLVERRRRRC